MTPAPITVEFVLRCINQLAPPSFAESWDNVGLLIGAPDQQVTGIMVGLDPTSQLFDEAIAHGANLLITHHPIIFSALKAIRTDLPTGALIRQAIVHHLGVIACHTNLDAVPNGVSASLARQLGLGDLSVLSPSLGGSDGIGCGQLGSLSAPLTGKEFLGHLCTSLGLPLVSVAGRLPALIERVAVCGGSGSEFAALAQSRGAQVFITGEVKHHIARWAEESGFCVVDAGHFATEQGICRSFAAELTTLLADQALSPPVFLTEQQKNPFSFFMNESVIISTNERCRQ